MTPQDPTIPHGFCHCRCGQRTNIATVTNRTLGHVKGEPHKYAPTHSSRCPRFILPVEAAPFKIEGVYCRLIPLTRDLHTIVWEIDYGRLAVRKWNALRTKGGAHYASRNAWQDELPAGRTEQKLFMHVALLDPPEGLTVDHISGCSLDNRRSNLRIATMQE